MFKYLQVKHWICVGCYASRQRSLRRAVQCTMQTYGYSWLTKLEGMWAERVRIQSRCIHIESFGFLSWTPWVVADRCVFSWGKRTNLLTQKVGPKTVYILLLKDEAFLQRSNSNAARYFISFRYLWVLFKLYFPLCAIIISIEYYF